MNLHDDREARKKRLKKAIVATMENSISQSQILKQQEAGDIIIAIELHDTVI